MGELVEQYQKTGKFITEILKKDTGLHTQSTYFKSVGF